VSHLLETCYPSYVLIRTSGAGVGTATVKVVLEATIQLMIEDGSYWRSELDEKYFTLAPRRASSDERRLKIKAFASIIMVAIFHGISPDPISPFLISSILQGKRVLQDRKFIASVAPLTAATLEDWPEDDSPIPATIKTQSLLANSNIQVSHTASILKCI
jgi:hypothetical protein